MGQCTQGEKQHLFLAPCFRSWAWWSHDPSDLRGRACSKRCTVLRPTIAWRVILSRRWKHIKLRSHHSLSCISNCRGTKLGTSQLHSNLNIIDYSVFANFRVSNGVWELIAFYSFVSSTQEKLQFVPQTMTVCGVNHAAWQKVSVGKAALSTIAPMITNVVMTNIVAMASALCRVLMLVLVLALLLVLGRAGVKAKLWV